MKKEMKTTLSAVDFVCATADCWSSSNRAYLGVTIHWLDESMIQKSKCKISVPEHCGRPSEGVKKHDRLVEHRICAFYHILRMSAPLYRQSGAGA